jgi:hypothetical protein
VAATSITSMKACAIEALGHGSATKHGRRGQKRGADFHFNFHYAKILTY